MNQDFLLQDFSHLYGLNPMLQPLPMGLPPFVPMDFPNHASSTAPLLSSLLNAPGSLYGPEGLLQGPPPLSQDQLNSILLGAFTRHLSDPAMIPLADLDPMICQAPSITEPVSKHIMRTRSLTQDSVKVKLEPVEDEIIDVGVNNYQPPQTSVEPEQQGSPSDSDSKKLPESPQNSAPPPLELEQPEPARALLKSAPKSYEQLAAENSAMKLELAFLKSELEQKDNKILVVVAENVILREEWDANIAIKQDLRVKLKDLEDKFAQKSKELSASNSNIARLERKNEKLNCRSARCSTSFNSDTSTSITPEPHGHLAPELQLPSASALNGMLHGTGFARDGQNSPNHTPKDFGHLQCTSDLRKFFPEKVELEARESPKRSRGGGGRGRGASRAKRGRAIVPTYDMILEAHSKPYVHRNY